MKLTYFSAAAFTIFISATVLTSCGDKNQGQQSGAAGMQQQAPVLGVMTITESNSTLDSAVPCTLEGENDVEIRPQVSGFLTKVLVEDGQHVNKGQVLFTIDDVQLKAAVEQAKAAVEVAQANVNTAQTNANNNKILLDKNIISASAYQTSVDGLNAAKAQLNQAKAALTSAQKTLSFSSVTAPVSGIVGTIPFKEGTLVSPSTLLTILSNNTSMQAYFSLNEKTILDLTENGARTIKQAVESMPEVTLQLPTGAIYPYKGKIVAISGVIDPTTGAASAKAIFPNPDGMLHSGNTGNILMPVEHDGIVEIPQNATYEVQDMKFVYVVGDSAKVHSRPITVAPLSDGQKYIVTEGLKPGEKIVVEGIGISVQDGMTITPKEKAVTNPDGSPML